MEEWQAEPSSLELPSPQCWVRGGGSESHRRRELAMTPQKATRKLLREVGKGFNQIQQNVMEKVVFPGKSHALHNWRLKNKP